MKKLLTVVFTMLLAASLSFAQTGGDKKPKPENAQEPNNQGAATAPTTKPPATHSGKKGHKKGHKKTKKGSGSTTPK